jgi:hypothetical protein
MLQTNPTPCVDINQLLELLLSGMQKILGGKLVGLYLNGSLVIGDFDPNISDIDLVAALSSDIDDKEFEELQKMHTDMTITQGLIFKEVEELITDYLEGVLLPEKHAQLEEHVVGCPGCRNYLE